MQTRRAKTVTHARRAGMRSVHGLFYDVRSRLLIGTVSVSKRFATFRASKTADQGSRMRPPCCPRLRHGTPNQSRCRKPDCRQACEGNRLSIPVANPAGEASAQGCADPDRKADEAER